MLPEQQRIVRNLSELARELDDLQKQIAQLDEDHVHKKSDYEQAYATAFLTSEGPMDVRKQLAVQACRVERLECELAEQLLRSAREKVRVVRDRLEVGRSLNAALRSQFAAEPVGQ